MNILNNVFTVSNLNHILLWKNSIVNEKVLKELELPHVDLLTDFNTLYYYLEHHYRNEYLFKNEMLNQLVISKGLNRVSALRELAIGNCIADFAVADQQFDVFEIKTGLDSLVRLSNQLTNYYQAFKYVSVMIAPQYYPEITTHLFTSDIGLYILHDNNQIETIREPQPHTDQLTYQSVFRILHKREYEAIIYKYHHHLSSADDMHYYCDSYCLIKQIPLLTLQNELEAQLKLRYLQLRPERAKLITDFPYALRHAIYFSNYGKNKLHDLHEILLQ